MELKDVIRTLRKKHNMTQFDVSRGIGISQSTVSSIERGARLPSYDMLVRFAEFFRVPVSALTDADNAPGAEEEDIASIISRSPKQRLLFDRTRYLSDADMDVVLSVVRAISKEREENG